MKIAARSALPSLFACLIFLPACGQSNNLLPGRVQATVGGHAVVVTDCYRTSVPPPQRGQDTPAGEPSYRFTPCRDADVLIRGEEPSVNGHSYGHLDAADGILVDHGVVSVHRGR